MDVIETLSVHSPTAPSPESPVFIAFQHRVVSLWYFTGNTPPPETTARTRIIAPNGTQLGEFPVEVNLTTNPRLRTFLNLGGLPVVVAGRYTFEVSLNTEEGWVVVAEIPVEIQVEVASISSSEAPPRGADVANR